MTTLAELRQASLKEQKQKEQQQRAPEQAPAAVQPAEAAPAPVSAAPVNGAKNNGHQVSAVETIAPVSAPATPPVIAAPDPPASPEALRAEKYFAKLHETLSHKTLHPSGAKVSADMPPALFHRAKRYCLDHGNITLRQVLIDLLTSYLEEEGY